MSFRLILCLTALAAPVSFAAAEQTTEVRIGIAEGAVYEAIIDGYPGIALLDGIPDLGGNALAVALKRNVTEMRGVAEFPLPSVALREPPDAVVLNFNIDDVLSMIGPGTEFDARAARSLFVHVYAANGTIELDDYREIHAQPHLVDTTRHGTITDASLARSGPLFFAVDVTAEALDVLAEGASHLGIVWRVEDSATGTSLDDLGDGAAGPPGVGGSTLPYVTFGFAVVPTPPPSSTPTITVPATPTSTPPVGPHCPGDCDGGGTVTVDEIVRLVGIALGSGDIASCHAGDTNDDGLITVDEVVNAIGMALAGCPTGTFRS